VNVASGNVFDFRNSSPASCSPKPLTLEVIDAVSTLADSESPAVLAGSQTRVAPRRSKRKML
jgi:hypothetical protein